MVGELVQDLNEDAVAVVIDGDDAAAGAVTTCLAESGFEVFRAESGRSGVDSVLSHVPMLVMLEVDLLGFDGYEVLRRIRQFSNCYVVVLSTRSREIDAVMAFQAGADDFVTKPVRPLELRSRIAAMQRRPRESIPGGAKTIARASTAFGDAKESLPEVLEHNGLVLHRTARSVHLEGSAVHLTRSEFDVLQAFLVSDGRAFNLGELAAAIGQSSSHEVLARGTDEARALQVHIGNLRKRLADDPGNPRWIMTLRGVGYRLAPKVADR